MASDITILHEGDRNVIVRVISGATDVAAETILDPTTLTPACTDLVLRRVQYDIASGVIAELLWDATANKPCLSMSGQNSGALKFEWFGGIKNDAGAGKTGSILLTTTGVAAAPSFTFIAEFVKAGTITR